MRGGRRCERARAMEIVGRIWEMRDALERNTSVAHGFCAFNKLGQEPLLQARLGWSRDVGSDADCDGGRVSSKWVGKNGKFERAKALSIQEPFSASPRIFQPFWSPCVCVLLSTGKECKIIVLIAPGDQIYFLHTGFSPDFDALPMTFKVSRATWSDSDINPCKPTLVLSWNAY